MGSPLAPLRIGDSLGHFRIQGRRGDGPLGALYLAEDVRSRTTVELEVVDPALTDERRRVDFLRSGIVATRIRHPNVVAVYAADEVDGRTFLARERVSGLTLCTMLDEDAPLEPERVLSYARQIAAALAGGETLGVGFGTLDSEAILITDDNVVKVSDSAVTDGVHGHDGLHAFGVVLLEMLAGAPPDRLHEIAQRCVATDAARRPSGGRELLEFLGEDDSIAGPDVPGFLVEVAQVPDAAPNPFAPGAGTPAASRFVVRRRLGSGGFGVVYEAFDRERHSTVALKVLRRHDGASVSRFKTEFRSLVDLAHDNLVHLYELHAEDDVWYFTMELIRGDHALAYVRPGGGYDEQRVRAVFFQLATGLTYLHRSGRLHRDVKPSNVMVTEEGRVVLVDFGLIGEIAEPEALRGAVGTPAYIAPEQASGLPVGEAADWYAVGVMLFQALTGRLPLVSAAPSTFAPGVPDDLDRLCVELMAVSPENRPPGPEVLRRLAHGDASPPPGGDGEVPFVGRAAQLAALREALDAAGRGEVMAVHVRGRAGMGKSTLLRRFFEEARAGDVASGRLVLFGRCFEQESVPYKGVDGLLEDLVRRLRERPSASVELGSSEERASLTTSFPQLRGILAPPSGAAIDGEAGPRRSRAFSAFRALLARVAPRGAVLVVDDLQWGDLDSVALLASLLHGPEPILLVIAYRAEDADSNGVLRVFFESIGTMGAQVRSLEVGELDGPEADALSRALLQGEAREGAHEEAVRALVADGQGNPFLLSELTRRAPGPSSGGAPQLDTLLAERIGRLPTGARRLLEVLAIEGQPVARPVAVRATFGAGEESDALGAVGVLRVERLIRSRSADGGEELLPYHDRIREVVTRTLDPGAGRAHHHQLALAHEAFGSAEPERLFFHYRGAGRLDVAAGYAVEAAGRAHEALAFDRAARLYRAALALRGGDDGPLVDEDVRLRTALADALAAGGRSREAAAAFLDAGRGGTPDAARALRRRAAELLLGAGYLDEGLATLRAVLLELGITLSASVWGSLLGFVWLRLRLRVRGMGFTEPPEGSVASRDLLRIDSCYAAVLGLFLINPILAVESQARHLLLALDAGEPRRIARALAVEALITAARRGTGPATDRLLAAARALEDRLGDPKLTGLVRLCQAYIALLGTQWARGRGLLVEAETALRRHGQDAAAEIDLVRIQRVNFLWMLGEVEELRQLVPRLIEEAEGRDSRMLEMMLRLGNAPNLALLDGRPDRAREAITAALARWPRASGSMLHVRELGTRARIALYEGACLEALAHIDEGLAASRWTGLRLVPAHLAELLVWGGLAAMSVGDLARAAHDARLLRRSRIPWANGAGRLIEAGIARRRGDNVRADACLEDARQRARTNGTALYGAAMAHRWGEWHPGVEGSTAEASADIWMTSRGIVDPRRVTAMLMGWA